MAPAKQGKLIGKISHYFDKIGVAVIDLSAGLKVDDSIRVIGGEIDFTQKVKSMEVDYKKIKKAKKGDAVGLKIKEKVRQGYKVYKA